MLDNSEDIYVSTVVGPNILEGAANPDPYNDIVPEDIEVIDEDEIIEVPEIEADPVVTEL